MTELGLLAALALVPVLVGASSSRAVRFAPRHLPPALSALLITGFALTVSLGTGVGLCLVAYLGTVEILPATHPADWSAPVLRRMLPIPAGAAVSAGILAAILILCALAQLIRGVASARRSAAAAAKLPGVGQLAIIDDSAVHACAIPGRGGRIVVSTGLLRMLSGPQRRAVLAHERSHVRHRHHVYVQLARLAAAANPLLRPVARAVDEAVERWADADAVHEVGDRAIVAHALGRAALARPSTARFGLGAARTDVVARVRDLLEPPARQNWVAALLAMAIVACWLSSVLALVHACGIVELAELAN